MELKEVVIHNPSLLHRPPNAIPCCIVCFQPQMDTHLFVLDDLECECNPNLHEACVQTWFQIAGQEVCPKCGEQWILLPPCARFEASFRGCLVLWLLVTLFIFGGVALYQIITNFYMKS